MSLIISLIKKMLVELNRYIGVKIMDDVTYICMISFCSRVTFYGNAFQHMFEAEHVFHQEIGKVSF